ncbi:MAG: flagellar motor switch protein FliN [Chloroflexi bacterium]|nr:flagellar motor switch protein FliN [Chloroflexota bacterium]
MNEPTARDGESLTARPAQFAPLMAGNLAIPTSNLSILLDIHLQVAVELGRARLTVKDVLALGPGSVVELDKLAGEPVDLRVNDQLVARGEVVVIDDKFGIRVTEILAAPGTNGDQNRK